MIFGQVSFLLLNCELTLSALSEMLDIDDRTRHKICLILFRQSQCSDSDVGRENASHLNYRESIPFTTPVGKDF